MWTNYLVSLAERSPMLLLALVAIVVAIVRWRRHPGVSALITVAFILYLLKSFTFAFIFQWLPTLQESMHLSWDKIDTLGTVTGVVSDIFFSVVLLMLVIAAFSKRSEVTAI